jgi:hypothetical protein
MFQFFKNQEWKILYMMTRVDFFIMKVEFVLLEFRKVAQKSTVPNKLFAFL